ncbi:AEC family transporter [Thermophilibacter sp.]
MLDVIVKVSSFVLIILIGIAAARSGKFGEGASLLISRIVFNLTLPCAIVRAFESAELTPALLGLIPLGFVMNIVPFLASYLVYRRRPREELVFQQANVCGLNIGCFALSFVQAFFPATGVVATCLFDAGNSLMGTGGTWALIRSLVLGTDHDLLRDRLKVFARTLFSSVPFDCYVVLIAMGLAGAHLPEPVITLISPLADANAFLSMFMIGLMIRFTVDAQRAHELARVLAWRLACSAALTLAALFVLPFDGVARQALIVLAWAPAASTGPLYTLWAGGDDGLAGMANALTVLLGVIIMTTLVIVMGVQVM